MWKWKLMVIQSHSRTITIQSQLVSKLTEEKCHGVTHWFNAPGIFDKFTIHQWNNRHMTLMTVDSWINQHKSVGFLILVNVGQTFPAFRNQFQPYNMTWINSFLCQVHHHIKKTNASDYIDSHWLPKQLSTPTYTCSVYIECKHKISYSPTTTVM